MQSCETVTEIDALCFRKYPADYLGLGCEELCAEDRCPGSFVSRVREIECDLAISARFWFDCADGASNYYDVQPAQR